MIPAPNVGQSVLDLGIVDFATAWAIFSFILLSIVLSITFVYFIFKSDGLNNTNLRSYRGKTILLTGASSGIGYRFAEQLYCAGARLILVGRNSAALNDLVVDLLKISANSPDIAPPPIPQIILADLSLPETLPNAMNNGIKVYDPTTGIPTSLVSLVDKLALITEQIDVFIACAGVSTRTSVVDASAQTNQHIMNLNFVSIQTLITMFLQPNSPVQLAVDGKVIAISSVQALIHIPWRATYAASKAALTAWLRSLSFELSLTDQKRSVTIVLPGYVNTALSLNSLAGKAGELYGAMDQNTQQGLDPDYVAKKSLQAGAIRMHELYLCPPTHQAIIMLQNICSPLTNFFLKRQGKKTLMTMQEVTAAQQNKGKAKTA